MTPLRKVLIIGGVLLLFAVMHLMGAQAETSMGVLLVGCGVFLIAVMPRYLKNPVYVDASGRQQTVGKGTLYGMVVLGFAIACAGCYLMAYGLPQ